MSSMLPIKIVEGSLAPRYEETVTELKNIKAVITRHGMASGLPLVDLQFTDEEGKEYFTMISSNLISMLAGAVAGVIQRSNDEENNNGTH